MRFDSRKRSPGLCYLDKTQGWTKICLLFITLPFLRKDKAAWFNLCMVPIFCLGFISQGVACWFLAHSCTMVICPGAHSRCPKDLKSLLHSISKQKNRQSLGIPEHMVALSRCANSVQPWTISSCVGKWRQVPGKGSREQASGRWGWQGCSGCDLLMQGIPSIPGCCPSFMGSCVTPEILLKSLLVISSWCRIRFGACEWQCKLAGLDSSLCSPLDW